MSRPHIVAEARLSNSNLSFTTGPDPDLVVSLKLENKDKPITIARNNLPHIFIATNAIVLYDSTSQKKIPLPTLDVNMRSSPPLALVPAMTNQFVTLEPGSSHEIINIPFRPLGPRRMGDGSRNTENIPDKYLFAKLGMHLLDPGHEYTMKVRDDLGVSLWMEGRLEELLETGPEWRPCHGTIDIVPSDTFHFKVEG